MKSDRVASLGAFDKVLANRVHRRHSCENREERRRDKVKPLSQVPILLMNMALTTARTAPLMQRTLI